MLGIFLRGPNLDFEPPGCVEPSCFFHEMGLTMTCCHHRRRFFPRRPLSTCRGRPGAGESVAEASAPGRATPAARRQRLFQKQPKELGVQRRKNPEQTQRQHVLKMVVIPSFWRKRACWEQG